MTADNLVNLGINAVVIVGSMGVAYNRLTNRMSIIETKLSMLCQEIHENGFIRKDVAEEMVKSADSTHKHLQNQINELRPPRRRK